MKILLFGADGYIGWPLAMRLVARGHRVLLVDNFLRRKTVDKIGGGLFELPSLTDRIKILGKHFPKQEIRHLNLDVSTSATGDLIKDERPDLIYHMAQQPSAPLSMCSVDDAAFTIQNNELGNIRILFGMRDFAPKAHLVKLGSFGEYAQCGLDITEGDFFPTHADKTANRAIPFPRQANDVYHITKICDSQYVSMAARLWNLQVTEIMQSTVYGIHTAETQLSYGLLTRFDYDSVFGTVLNRFVSQMAVGLPMTVYGSGLHTTGLISLPYTVSVLETAGSLPRISGHKLINSVEIKQKTIISLAQAIAQIGKSFGLNPTIDRSQNPRHENAGPEGETKITTDFLKDLENEFSFEKVIRDTLYSVISSKDRIRQELLTPTVDWHGQS